MVKRSFAFLCIVAAAHALKSSPSPSPDATSVEDTVDLEALLDSKGETNQCAKVGTWWASS